MITSAANSASYLRSSQAFPSKTTLTAADAQLPSEAAAPAVTQAVKLGQSDVGFRVVDVSQLKMPPLEIGIRDFLATVCWEAQLADQAGSTDVPDHAGQNIYATVRVDGKIVARLYSGGSSVMTNDAAEKVGAWQDPPGLSGPDLAQWRAERIAKAVGGTVENVTTPAAQSESEPRESTDDSRAQFDAAFNVVMAKQHRTIAQRSADYSALTGPARSHTDFSA